MTWILGGRSRPKACMGRGQPQRCLSFVRGGRGSTMGARAVETLAAMAFGWASAPRNRWIPSCPVPSWIQAGPNWDSR